tara:strand:+ start:593 stop:907 length:315 start_codon:yes stop_codon:yes gene_type:complete
MKCTLDFSDFCEAFRRFDRQENFSREGLELLFDHCEELDPDMELDVIALCCDYCEDTLEDVISSYSIDVEDMDDDDTVEAVRAYLSENTTVLGETLNGFVYASF